MTGGGQALLWALSIALVVMVGMMLAASCGGSTQGLPDGLASAQPSIDLGVDRLSQQPVRIPTSGQGFGPGPGSGFGTLGEGLDEDLPVIVVEYNGGLVSIYSPYIVGFYYTEIPALLDPDTDVFTPTVTGLSDEYIDTVHFLGNIGYMMGYFEYTYEDLQGNPLPDPIYEVAYQMLNTDESPIELLPGHYVISPQMANEQVGTTCADPESGKRCVYFLLPGLLNSAPDIVGDTERKMLATVGFEGELAVTPSAVSGGFVDISSAYFLSEEDIENHMVPLRKKSDGTYYMVGEEVLPDDPGTIEWVTPLDAEAILGITVEPFMVFPTGHEYYDAYIQTPEYWDVDPLDLEGVNLDQPISLILQNVFENKFERLTGEGLREVSWTLMWLPWLKKVFSEPHYPYGGNTYERVGPHVFSNFEHPFYRGDILTARYYRYLSNPLTYVPSCVWPMMFHHTGIVVTDKYNYQWQEAETIEAVGPGKGVQRLPYPRVWVYNSHLWWIVCAFDKKLWYEVPSEQREGVIGDLMYFWENSVGNPYSIFANKYAWDKHYCSQLAFVGYWDGGYYYPWYFRDNIDALNFDTRVYPIEILVDRGMKFEWYWTRQ